MIFFLLERSILRREKHRHIQIHEVIGEKGRVLQEINEEILCRVNFYVRGLVPVSGVDGHQYSDRPKHEMPEEVLKDDKL